MHTKAVDQNCKIHMTTLCHISNTAINQSHTINEILIVHMICFTHVYYVYIRLLLLYNTCELYVFFLISVLLSLAVLLATSVIVPAVVVYNPVKINRSCTPLRFVLPESYWILKNKQQKEIFRNLFQWT